MFYEFPLWKNHNKSAVLASISNKANLINKHCELNVITTGFLEGRMPWFVAFANFHRVKTPTKA